ncbi:MBL fold metallo-hydrolase [Wenjunlia vitaminophila]|uniref:MBL fold metallo-hydrolase n=1 Tax=Wenjunlia vitaminophila TaxID=76728 RepID=A0A0T6LNQ6_WENVI|nr:MBL fold metallo-hydrolase [Wenjunlia vitaminophila]KRV47735.1 MBL fold metallo-hydrolase [Wenjunlia vitaminophila]
MKLTVVGCAGTFPSADSPCSSYLIQADGFCLLLDMGNGALGGLQRHCGLYDLDAVLLSHLHTDHFIDMCNYWVVRYYRHEGPVMDRLPVYGPRGTEERLCDAYGGDLPKDSAMREVFDFRTLAPGRFSVGPFTVYAERVCHPVEAFGFRIEHDGSALVYSGDTGPCAALVDLARDADLLLCEASFTDGKEDVPGLHLNGRQAGEHAARAGAARLVLTHIPPWTDPARNLTDARAAFPGPVEVARAGEVYEL